MSKKKHTRTKAGALLLAAALLLGCAIGGTFAWLVDRTDPVQNTFTAANIDITLTETPNADSNDADTANDIWRGSLVPGTEIAKDPVVTVEPGSEACWLFVKAEKEGGNVTAGTTAYDFDDFVAFTVAGGWYELAGEQGVYYREVSAADAKAGVSYSVIEGSKVSIPGTVTKAMLDKITAANEPKLTFTAYAVQREGFEQASLAWAEAESLS